MSDDNGLAGLFASSRYARRFGCASEDMSAVNAEEARLAAAAMKARRATGVAREAEAPNRATRPDGAMERAGRRLEKAISAAGKHLEQAAKDLTIDPGR